MGVTNVDFDHVRPRTRAFISKHLSADDLQDDDDIFELGFVNSLFAMQLVMFVENEFNMTVDDEDLEIDNFRSIDAVVNLVTRKTGHAA